MTEPTHDVARPTPEQCSALLSNVLYELQEIPNVIAMADSALSSDDQYLKPFGLSMHQIVICRLLSALDHLKLTAISLKLQDIDQPVFPQYSLVRAALTGAATAHWVIPTDKVERRRRALMLTYYDLNEQLKFLKLVGDGATKSPHRHPYSDHAEEIFLRASANCQLASQEYVSICEAQDRKAPKDGKPHGVVESDIINEMGKILFESGVVPTTTELILQYKLMSGYVHNCVWAAYTGTHVRSFQGEISPMVEMTGNSTNIYRAATLALHIVRLTKQRAVDLAAAPQVG